jgi:hypothetical protein
MPPKSQARAETRPDTTAAPERWSLAAGDAATVTLTIPPDARRERRFEIACAATVAVPEAAAGAWHQMTVQAGGTQLWRRRIPSSNPGAWDGLDYRFSRSVPVGQALRITVAVACAGSRRRTLVIEADETR